MQFDKIINEFEVIKTKLDKYEKEHNSIVTILKVIEKNNKKITNRIKTTKNKIEKKFLELELEFNKNFTNQFDFIFKDSLESESKENV